MNINVLRPTSEVQSQINASYKSGMSFGLWHMIKEIAMHKSVPAFLSSVFLRIVNVIDIALLSDAACHILKYDKLQLNSSYHLLALIHHIQRLL